MAYTEDQIGKLIGQTWARYLWRDFNEPYMLQIMQYIRERRQVVDVYPESKNVFKAFQLCPLDKNLKVVIIGQDPYHTPGMANGLAFSVDSKTYCDYPPSLKNILNEMENDLGFPAGLRSGDLSDLAEQGVLLLNSCLTVEKGNAGSHSNIGWQNFTIKALSLLRKKNDLVIIRWGKHAENVSDAAGFTPLDQLFITSSHPSPFSAHRSFFGSKPFSRTNAYLEREGQKSINWTGMKDEN